VFGRGGRKKREEDLERELRAHLDLGGDAHAARRAVGNAARVKEEVRPNFRGGGLLDPGNAWMRVLARPREGVSAALAQARLNEIWPGLSKVAICPDWPAARREAVARATFRLDPGGTGYTYLRQTFRRPLFALLGVTGLVLLIASANVSNLLLARAAAR
jgi:hypothetical protein